MVDVGYLAYQSGVEVIDLGGVTDPQIAQLPGGHLDKAIPVELLQGRDPQALLLHSAHRPRHPEGRLRSLSGYPVERRVARLPWVREHRGESYDASGAWAAEHTPLPELLAALLDDDYFTLQGPRSTGPERFNLDWLRDRLTGEERAGDVQATISELSARAIVQSVLTSGTPVDAIYVCGGGARNTDLMRRLHLQLDAQAIRLGTTDELGLVIPGIPCRTVFKQ